ncbi:MAG: hypothetical protein GY711_25300 [bacterium]|nr:hypothetical protein [bacterium]
MNKHQSLRLAFVIGVLCTPIGAQVPVYDAGVAGDPAVAPDPQTQGWQLWTDGSGINLTPVSPDPGTGLNVWEIADNGPAQDSYAKYNLDTLSFDAIANGTWEYVATMRVTAGSSPVLFIEINTGFTFGDTGYRVRFQIVGNTLRVLGLHAGEVYDCPGALDGQHHTFAIRKTNPAPYSDAEFFYDGVSLGPLGEFAAIGTWTYGLVWGTLEWAGTARARFHKVEFRGLDPIGTAHCLPAVPNSTGSGATISAYGHTNVSHNAVRLEADSLPPNQFGYFLASSTSGFIPNPGGSQGNLCLTGQVARFNRDVQSSGPAGRFTLPVDLSAIPLTPPVAVQPGETWNFQGWYRDQNPTSTSNFTEALRIAFQ